MERKEVWERGDRYERYVGRWSRLVAPPFLAWLAVPAGRDWLDVGCGTGALAGAILDSCDPRSVRGIDSSGEFLAQARARIVDPRAAFLTADARSLPFDAAGFDAVVSALALNFVPEPSHAVAEMARVARPTGIVAAYVWDYAGKMEPIRRFWEAANALDPALELDEGRRFPMCAPEPLAALFSAAALQRVEVRAIDIPARFPDFDDYWSPFLGGQGPAPAYATSLDAERRDALRERLRSTVPFEDDGSLRMTARAWAVRGFR